MKKKYFWFFATVICLLLCVTVSCAYTPTPTVRPTPTLRPTMPAYGYYKLILVTAPAKNVTRTSAYISGTVYLGEKVGNPWTTPDIMLSLVYWEAANPSQKTAVSQVFNYMYPKTIWAVLQNLKPNTKYQFALVANGSNYGNIQSFTTLP
jgi:hypothetical protein